MWSWCVANDENASVNLRGPLLGAPTYPCNASASMTTFNRAATIAKLKMAVAVVFAITFRGMWCYNIQGCLGEGSIPWRPWDPCWRCGRIPTMWMLKENTNLKEALQHCSECAGLPAKNLFLLSLLQHPINVHCNTTCFMTGAGDSPICWRHQGLLSPQHSNLPLNPHWKLPHKAGFTSCANI